MTFSSPLRLSRGIAIAVLCALVGNSAPVFAQQFPHEPVKVGYARHSVAARLNARLERRFGAHDMNVADVLRHKHRLQTARLVLRLHDEQSGQDSQDITLSLAEHPDWIVFDAASRTFVPDERSIRYFLEFSNVIPRPSPTVVVSSGSGTVAVEGESAGGFVIDSVDVSARIVEAFSSAKPFVVADATYSEPMMMLVDERGASELTLLSRGMSDFAKSPYGREANIRRALETYLDGVVIPAGGEFSFNDAFANSHGWRDALIIAEGGTLVQEPGGGICQAASTVFRAALLAGLPIVKRANHSLYVGYYEEYGVGLDATVYPGKQDFTFKNDTGSPIVVSARSDGTKAIVEFYGKSDGRTVALSGPFFSTSNDGFDQPLRINQIAWNYRVTYSDGHDVEEPILSTYTMLPKVIRTKYAEAQGERLLSELVKDPAEGLVGVR